MRPRKFTTIRQRFPKKTEGHKFSSVQKKVESVMEDNRFRQTMRLAKERASLKTEHARLHGMLYAQIAPHLRERVMQQGRHINQRLDQRSLNDLFT